MIKDAASRELPFPREVLIDAARLKARGAEWETIAGKTGADVAELVTFSIDHPEVWGPLYERAEKLRLQEAEGETIKGLCTLLKGDSDEASECAAKELLIHRRYVERRRQGGRRAKPRDLGIRISDCGTDQSAIRDPQSAMAAETAAKYPEFLTEDPPPEEIVRRITYAANRVAHGDDYHRIARETGHPEVDVTRWAFIYAKAWDKAYPTARRAAAQAGAALAVNRLLDFVVGPDLKQAARAGRLLLVHRRHMHWGSAMGDMYRKSAEGGSGTCPPNRAVGNAGEGAGTYPPSVAQASVTIGGDTARVARRSGPARATGTVRPSADSASVSSVYSVVKSRDGP